MAAALSVAGMLAAAGEAAAAPNQTQVCVRPQAVADLGCQTLDVDGQAIAALADVADAPCAIVGERPYDGNSNEPIQLCRRSESYRYPNAWSGLAYVVVSGAPLIGSSTTDTATECGTKRTRGLSVLGIYFEVAGVDRSRWNC